MNINGIEYRPAFGIPYARVTIDGRRVAGICPRCGLAIDYRMRKDFESYAGSEYAVHYFAEHARNDGLMQVEGTWYEPVP